VSRWCCLVLVGFEGIGNGSQKKSPLMVLLVGRSNLESKEFQSAKDTAITNKALAHIQRLDAVERKVHLKNCLGVPWQFDLPNEVQRENNNYHAPQNAQIANDMHTHTCMYYRLFRSARRLRQATLLTLKCCASTCKR
jgi:hypothetical protein